MIGKRPDWLRVKASKSDYITSMHALIKEACLNSVCVEASCPNISCCFAEGVATFLLLGKTCTRRCRYCNIEDGVPEPVDGKEPEKISRVADLLKLNYLVITSVTRDDLPDGGAGHFASTVRHIKSQRGSTVIELLIPDFRGDTGSLNEILLARPDVIGCNIETVPSLYRTLRPSSSYDTIIGVLKYIKENDEGIFTKSGIMVGLGESADEVKNVMADLKEARCDIITIGQYLRPTKRHYEVKEYIHPDMFKEYENLAYQAGFKYVACSPMVRSSYKASEIWGKISKDLTEYINDYRG